MEEEIAEAAEVHPAGEAADDLDEARAGEGEGAAAAEPDTQTLPDLFAGLPEAPDLQDDGDAPAEKGRLGDGAPGSGSDRT